MVIHIFKALWVEEYLKEMKAQFINIIEELKSTRFSWKMKLMVGVVFEYDDDKNVETEIFIRNINGKTIMLETDSDVFSDVFVSSKSIRCVKVNAPKD